MILLGKQNIPKYYINANGVVGSECFRRRETGEEGCFL